MSYTVWILITLVRLKEFRKLLIDHTKKVEYPGHVEMAVDAPNVQRSSSSSSFRSPGLPAESLCRLDRHDFLLPTMHRPRSSQETTSSLSSIASADMPLVTDGFRPADEPPAYASRPGSLHSAKGDSVKGD